MDVLCIRHSFGNLWISCLAGWTEYSKHNICFSHCFLEIHSEFYLYCVKWSISFKSVIFSFSCIDYHIKFCSNLQVKLVKNNISMPSFLKRLRIWKKFKILSHQFNYSIAPKYWTLSNSILSRESLLLNRFKSHSIVYRIWWNSKMDRKTL